MNFKDFRLEWREAVTGGHWCKHDGGWRAVVYLDHRLKLWKFALKRPGQRDMDFKATPHLLKSDADAKEACKRELHRLLFQHLNGDTNNA